MYLMIFLESWWVKWFLLSSYVWPSNQPLSPRWSHQHKSLKETQKKHAFKQAVAFLIYNFQFLSLLMQKKRVVESLNSSYLIRHPVLKLGQAGRLDRKLDRISNILPSFWNAPIAVLLNWAATKLIIWRWRTVLEKNFVFCKSYDDFAKCYA